MGRKVEGATKRTELVAFRLNDEEKTELVENMSRRGLTDKSHYFRQLMHEDSAR